MARGKSKGIVQGFLGGLSTGMADAGKMMFSQQLRDEGNEANSLRERALRTDLQEDRQEFLGSEGDKNRASAQGIAKDKATATASKDGTTSQMKNVRDLMANGNKTFDEAVQVVYPGAKIQHTDVEGNRIVSVQENGKWVEIGKFTEDDKGSGYWLGAGDEPRRTPGKFTSEEVKAEQAALNKESGNDDDYIPFNEASKDEAKESLTKKQSSGKSGIVNSAVDIDRTTPETAMPAPKQSAPKAALDYLAKNPKALPQFIEKYGYDPTKQ